MIAAPPELKFRQDLIFSPPQAPVAGTDAPAVVVKDPETGKFFRLRAVEHFIAQQLDGSTPLEVIQRRVEEQFQAPLAHDALKQFVKTLRRVGLLEQGEDGDIGPARKRGPFRGSLLYFRVKLFDPNRLFDRLIGKIRFFFTPTFLVCSAAVILLAGGIALANWEEIGRDLRTLIRLETILWVWLTILAATTVHEFGHGLTCKHFGGEVHEVGFFMMYFQPCFYCNVSDAWLFPEKSKRLWVAVAGPYVEFFLAALATIAWRITDQETWLNRSALVVMATSGVMTFLDFNPLMKRDGYYVLSDCLNLPNLRKRSFAYIGAGVRRMFGLKVKAAEVSARERRIYLTYGLLAGAYSSAVLGGISWLLGGALIDNLQGAGFILFGAVVPLIFRKPLKRSMKHIPDLIKSAPAHLAQVKRTATFVGLIGVLLALLFLVHLELTVWGEFKIVPIQNTDIRAEVEGIVTEILVKEQDRVEQGDVIARLSDQDILPELRKTQAETDALKAKLKLLKAGARPEELDLARKSVETARMKQEKALALYEQAKKEHAEQLAKATIVVEKTEQLYDQAKHMRSERLVRSQATVEKAEEHLRYKEKELARVKGLFEKGFISRKEFDAAEEEKTIREKALDEARAELKQLQADDLAGPQRDVEAARGDLKLVLVNDLVGFRNEIAVAEKELDEPKGRLAVLLAGSRREEIEATEAELVSLETQVRYLSDQNARLSVVSPVSGIITTQTRHLHEMIGQHVVKGALIAAAHELTTVTAEISVSEKEIADVAPGQTVALKARAYPERKFDGTVRTIATTAAGKLDGGVGSTVLVLTQLDNSSLWLKPDMTGNAKIYCGQRSIFDLVTRRVARYFRVEMWSWW